MGEEGGAPAPSEVDFRLVPPTNAATNALTGTAHQIEWAEQIKERVSQDFDRVANAMKSVAAKQVERGRTDTQALIAILEDKRKSWRRIKPDTLFMIGESLATRCDK
jgi:hypothetical protein